ncbi:MAG: alpha/beta fold hydrolase [Rhizobacter sp.]
MPLDYLSLDTSRGPLPYLHGAPTRPSTNAPLLVFLHGGRDRGDDLNLLLRWSPPKQVAASAERDYHFVAPQLPADGAWTDRPGDVLDLIDEVVDTHGIDPRRVVLAGFSLGAAAAWELAARHPERFAGLAVASGRVPRGLSLEALARTPTWVFHGGLDDKLPHADVEAHVADLRAHGGRVEYTLYTQGNHFISEQAFVESGFEPWLLERVRAIEEPLAA